MTLRFTILFVLTILLAPFADAQTHTFVLQHRTLGRFTHTNWSVTGSRSVRMTSLILKDVSPPGKRGTLLRGTTRYESTGGWNIEAYRVSPGRYKVWHTRPGSQPWFSSWTIPVVRLNIAGNPQLAVTALTLNTLLPNAVLSGTVQFNGATGLNFTHGARLQPKR